jgi:RNA 2',3'-cyclic 3'-phosphodiesterase
MPVTLHNLFFALRPDAEAAAHIARLTARLRDEHGLTGRAVDADRLHISLNSLGAHPELPEQLVAKVIAAVATVAMPPFLVALNRVATWKGGVDRRPLVLWGDEGVIGVETLHAKIHAALVAEGLARRRARPMMPHLTVLRDAIEMPEEVIAPVRWTVREFVLVDSLRGEGRHVVLGRWPLGA